MVTVMLDEDSEALLRQHAADLDIPPCEVARVILESSLLMSLSR
jgi:hypothetical protein